MGGEKYMPVAGTSKDSLVWGKNHQNFNQHLQLTKFLSLMIRAESLYA